MVDITVIPFTLNIVAQIFTRMFFTSIPFVLAQNRFRDVCKVFPTKIKHYGDTRPQNLL